MSELEDIRNMKFAQYQEQQKVEQQITQLESTVKHYLDKEAVERYNNLKTAHQELAIQVLVVLSQAVQTGQVAGIITDQQFKEILMKLMPQKKDFKIMRK